jgi:hypothetical protein
MARVNCYLPDQLRDLYRETFGAGAGFSELLREGVVARLQEHGALPTWEQPELLEPEQLEGDGPARASTT